MAAASALWRKQHSRLVAFTYHERPTAPQKPDRGVQGGPLSDALAGIRRSPDHGIGHVSGRRLSALTDSKPVSGRLQQLNPGSTLGGDIDKKGLHLALLLPSGATARQTLLGLTVFRAVNPQDFVLDALHRRDPLGCGSGSACLLSSREAIPQLPSRFPA